MLPLLELAVGTVMVTKVASTMMDKQIQIIPDNLVILLVGMAAATATAATMVVRQQQA